MDVDDLVNTVPDKGKTKRRSVRGRRSSIMINIDANVTPIEADVPISTEVHNSTIDELSVALKQKTSLEDYMKSLEKESAQYDTLLEKADNDLGRAFRKIDHPLAEDGCPEARAGADGRKARNVVQKVMKTFRQHNEQSLLKNENEDIEKEILALNDALDNETAACERLLSFLLGESLEDLAEYNDYLQKRIDKTVQRQNECVELFGYLID